MAVLVSWYMTWQNDLYLHTIYSTQATDKNFCSQYYYPPDPPSLDLRLVRSEVPRDAQLYQLSNKNTDGSCEVSEQKLESCLFLCELKLNLIWTEGFLTVFTLFQYFLIEWKCLKYNQDLRKCHRQTPSLYRRGTSSPQLVDGFVLLVAGLNYCNNNLSQLGQQQRCNLHSNERTQC